MEFRVFRTTSWDGPDKPCEEAIENRDGSFSILIKDLAALMAFANKHKRIIIDGDSLEIYDDYRE